MSDNNAESDMFVSGEGEVVR